MNSFFSPRKNNQNQLNFPWFLLGRGKNPPEILQPKMLRSLARCPISHTLRSDQKECRRVSFGEEKSLRNHLQHMKNGISNCYVNGVSNVYIYIYMCVCVCLCKYIYAIRLHTNVYILYIYMHIYRGGHIQ